MFVPLALQNKLVAFDPRPGQGFAAPMQVTGQPRGVLLATSGGAWSPPGGGECVLTLQLSDSIAIPNISGAVSVTGGQGMSLSVRIPAELFELYRGELPYNTPFFPGPGLFELPAAVCAMAPARDAGGGSCCGACAVSVQAMHRHLPSGGL